MQAEETFHRDDLLRQGDKPEVPLCAFCGARELQMRMLGMVSCLQAAPATADPVEGAKKDVPPSVLLLRCSARFPRTWQDLAVAQSVRDLAIRRLDTAQDVLEFVSARWKDAAQAKIIEDEERWKVEVTQAEEKVKQAEEKVKQADEKVDRAKVEVKQAEEKVGRAKAGGFCVLLAVAFGLHSRKVVLRFRAVHRLLFGVVLSSRQGSPRR